MTSDIGVQTSKVQTEAEEIGLAEARLENVIRQMKINHDVRYVLCMDIDIM